MVADALKKEEEEKKKKEAAADDAARQRIAHAKNPLSFTIPWAQAGHPEVPRYSDFEAVKAMVLKRHRLGRRHPIVGGEGDPRRVAGGVHKALPRQALGQDPVCHAGGSGDSGLRQGVGDVVADRLPVVRLLSKHEGDLGQHMVDGAHANVLRMRLGGPVLHSVRYLSEGCCAFLMSAAEDLEKALKVILGQDSINAETMRVWVDNLGGGDKDKICTEQLAAFKAAGLKAWHVKLLGGQTLVTPPAFLTACAVLQSAPSLGVRRVFMPKGQSTRANFVALANVVKSDAAALQHVKSTLDALVVASASGA